MTQNGSGVSELGEDVVDNSEDTWKDIFLLKECSMIVAIFRLYWSPLEVELYIKTWGNIKKKIKVN